MKQKKLFVQDRIRFMKNSLLIDEKLLVFGDLHIGFEESIAGNGLIPRRELNDILRDLKDIFIMLDKEKVKLKKIIILGDLKHEFGSISEGEWRDVLKIIDFLNKKCNEIIIIKGNHDNILGPIARKKQVKLKNYYRDKEIIFAHGNKEYKKFYDKKIKILILGHLHPSLILSDNYKREKYKCFLKGIWRKKQVIILPSFSSITIGYDINSNHDDEDFLIVSEKNLKNFSVLIYNDRGDKVYRFGKVKN